MNKRIKKKVAIRKCQKSLEKMKQIFHGADEEFYAPFVDAVLLRGDRSSDRVDAGRVVPVADAGPSARPDGRRRAPLWPG